VVSPAELFFRVVIYRNFKGYPDLFLPARFSSPFVKRSVFMDGYLRMDLHPWVLTAHACPLFFHSCALSPGRLKRIIPHAHAVGKWIVFPYDEFLVRLFLSLKRPLPPFPQLYRAQSVFDRLEDRIGSDGTSVAFHALPPFQRGIVFFFFSLL